MIETRLTHAGLPLPRRRDYAEAIADTRTRLTNLWWERRLAISTRGVVPTAHPDSVHYATMSYPSIWPVLSRLELAASDVFVDVGCGKGRVLCCAARYSVERVAGVDLSETLCATARDNARSLRGRRAPIFVETAQADRFDYSEATVLFLFDPFGPTTLTTVLDKIRCQPHRRMRIAYANPTCEEVLQRQDWLERTDHWPAGGSGVEHAVSFYRSV